MGPSVLARLGKLSYKTSPTLVLPPASRPSWGTDQCYPAKQESPRERGKLPFFNLGIVSQGGFPAHCSG